MTVEAARFLMINLHDGYTWIHTGDAEHGEMVRQRMQRVIARCQETERSTGGSFESDFGIGHYVCIFDSKDQDKLGRSGLIITLIVFGLDNSPSEDCHELLGNNCQLLRRIRNDLFELGANAEIQEMTLRGALVGLKFPQYANSRQGSRRHVSNSDGNPILSLKRTSAADLIQMLALVVVAANMCFWTGIAVWVALLRQ